MVEMAVFAPEKYLTKVNGGDYLEVKWRLVWFRTDHADAVIDTDLVSHDDAIAIFRARVSIPGAGSSTGWGSESLDDFHDYIEKAETKALGRALAALGYGTQFCPDFEFGSAENRVVDSPIDISRTREHRDAEPSPATPRQIRFLHAIAQEAGLSEDELEQESYELFGRSVSELPRRDASSLIERLQRRRESARSAS